MLVRRGRRSGLFTFVAVHSTVLGPALGGCRLWGYEDSRAALRDALALSRAMTYKAAVAGLALGGGKGVIMVPLGSRLSPERRHAALLDFADTVESLDGHYITAEDVGTSSRDMSLIAERTRHVAGLPRARGGSGDPSAFTALGVEAAVKACCERVFSTSALRGGPSRSSAWAMSVRASPSALPEPAPGSSSRTSTRASARSPRSSAPAG